MPRPTQISIPTLVRVKPGGLDRVGVYLNRDQHQSVTVLISHGLHSRLVDRFKDSLAAQEIDFTDWYEVEEHSLDFSYRVFTSLQSSTAIVGVGGGKALDVAKYVGFLSRLPYYAVPTSLSNDGFCSPQSSLLVNNKRKSLPSAIPYGVVIDTEVCRQAPEVLTCSGVGDLVSKFTAVADWKLAFHKVGEPVHDFAALLSDGSIYAFMGNPKFDLEGMRLLATALLMNGLAMEMCGSSRPASGSEHLVSHAFDLLSPTPRLHGLQVGVATYMISQLHNMHTQRIAKLFELTGFWNHVYSDPFCRATWIEAIMMAPSIKPNYVTILTEQSNRDRLIQIMHQDPLLERAFYT